MSIATEGSAILSIRGVVARLRADGLPISERAIRNWVRSGELPCRFSGEKALLFYPNVLEYLHSGEEHSVKNDSAGAIRRVDL